MDDDAPPRAAAVAWPAPPHVLPAAARAWLLLRVATGLAAVLTAGAGPMGEALGALLRGAASWADGLVLVQAAGGALLAAGLATRVAGVAVAGAMAGAVFGTMGPGETLPAWCAAAALAAGAFALLGGGRWSLDQRLADRRAGA